MRCSGATLLIGIGGNRLDRACFYVSRKTDAQESLGSRCLLVDCGSNCYSCYGRAVLNMFKLSHLPLHAYVGLYLCLGLINSELRIGTTAVCFVL